MRVERHGDVERIVFTWWRSRLLGYDVSVYRTGGVLIDTGFPGAADQMHATLSARRPDAIILTHQHEDHAGNLATVIGAGIPMVMSEATRIAVTSLPPIGAYRRFAWGSPVPTPALAAASPESVGSLMLVHTPGHSSDHHAVWDVNSGTLFAGDLFLGTRVKVARPGEDPRQLVTSLRAAAALSPERMFDAHRGLVRNPVEALRSKADWLEATITRIDYLAAQGWSVSTIRRSVLGRESAAAVASAGDLSKQNFVRAVLGGAV